MIHCNFKNDSVGACGCRHVLKLRDRSLPIDFVYVTDEVRRGTRDVVGICHAVRFEVEMKCALTAISDSHRKTESGNVGHRIKRATGGCAREVKVVGFQATDIAGKIDVLDLSGSVVIGHAIDPQRSGVAGYGVCHRNGESPKDGNENSTNAQQLVPPADMFSVHGG